MQLLFTGIPPWFRALALSACVGAAAAPALASGSLPAVPTPEQGFQMGMEAQAARDYRAMLTLLRDAAGRGSVEAQEMLGMALLVGPTLYGPAVPANRCEAGLWLRKAVAQGSEVGRVQLDFLNRLRQSPSGTDVCQAWGG